MSADVTTKYVTTEIGTEHPFMSTASETSPTLIKKPLAVLAMCPPDFFDISYIINPWMNPNQWRSNAIELLQKAQNGWKSMHDTLEDLGVTVHLISPQPGLPDMVFPANSAIVLNRKALLSRFRYPERQSEQKHYAQFFAHLKEQGLLDEIGEFPEGVRQEGAGDCHWDAVRQMFWAGYGPRSSKEAAPYVEKFFGKPVLALELASDEFYHIDVSLCPLTGGEILYYPEAFTPASQEIILDRIPQEQLIPIDREDAANFAANAVNLENKLVMASASDRLEAQLKERGYQVIRVPVGTFGLSGGSAFCLTLRLDRTSAH
jgi:N-dimethylarginine dimethylaminohydrolase